VISWIVPDFANMVENSAIKIRLATLEDIEEVESLLLQSFMEYRSLYTEQGFAATTPASKELQNRMAEGPLWVALRDGTIVGTVSVIPRAEELYIRGMAVLPASRGLRLGELLLKQVESFALAHDYRRLILSTTPFLLRAIKLYEQSGFRRTKEGPNHLFGTPLLTMVKELSESRVE
jgi:N-acetylglutamate synthase-like GNAT family acetyltransferase